MVLQHQGSLPGEASLCWQMPAPSRILWCCWDGGRGEQRNRAGDGQGCSPGYLQSSTAHSCTWVCIWGSALLLWWLWCSPSHHGLAGVQPVLCHSGSCCQITLWSLLQVLMIDSCFKSHHWLLWVVALVDSNLEWKLCLLMTSGHQVTRKKGDDRKVLSVCDLSPLVSLFPVLWCKSRDLDMVGNHSLPESPSPWYFLLFQSFCFFLYNMPHIKISTNYHTFSF